MEDETEKNKKKKSSFLASLGFGSKTESQSAEGKKNVFYVGNVQSDLKKRKTVLESIE